MCACVWKFPCWELDYNKYKKDKIKIAGSENTQKIEIIKKVSVFIDKTNKIIKSSGQRVESHAVFFDTCNCNILQS